MGKESYDLAIVGAGITGTAIARELSQYNLRVVLIEKEADVSFGTTKGNSAIVHAGFDDQPGTLKGKLCREGNALYERLCQEIEVPFKRIGSLVVATRKSDYPILKELLARGRANNVPGLEIWDKETLRKEEPNLTSSAFAALFAPTAGIVSPHELTIALMENARDNGVEVRLETEVVEIRIHGPRPTVHSPWSIVHSPQSTVHSPQSTVHSPQSKFKIQNSKFKIQTSRGMIESKFVVNAAGLYADKISRMVGIGGFKITPAKGEYLLGDKEVGNLVNHVVFPTPTPTSKGIVVVPTVDGNLILGPNEKGLKDKSNLSTTKEGQEEVFRGAQKLVPRVSLRDVITSFAGLRARAGDDFIISAYPEVKGFINVAGIKSPGLSAAPAIAKYVVRILQEEGLSLKKKKEFNPLRKKIIKFSEVSFEERVKLIKRDSDYGLIVCRCEKVSLAEVKEAIRRGARTLDGIKYRVRCGMGRCQGGFCGPRIIMILAKELGISPKEITKKGKDSKVLLSKTKELRRFR